MESPEAFLIRSEVIEFATLPIILKISSKHLVKSFNTYLKGPETSISLAKITQILCELIPNFTEKDVLVLFILYKVVVDKEIEFLSGSIKSGDWKYNKVDVRRFCVFMILQNYRTNLDSSKKELNSSWSHNQFNESFRSSNRILGQNFSPMNSPRTKMNRQPGSHTEANSTLKAFIKSNLEVLLWIVSGGGDKTKESYSISSESYQLLDTIFELSGDVKRNISTILGGQSSTNAINAIEHSLSINECNYIV